RFVVSCTREPLDTHQAGVGHEEVSTGGVDGDSPGAAEAAVHITPATDGANEHACVGELLDVGVRIGHEDISANPVDGQADGFVELPAPFRQGDSIAVELLNAGVAVVDDEDVPGSIDTDPPNAVELSVTVSRFAPLDKEDPGIRELLDAT